ncbi:MULTISPECIES: cyclic peptide export ABC transporter [unclassified Halomonas]|uniref:cyclic peptide export ABC transporter n=1 Tax=unclassified Halomonas TaxID=2609666 RepID=UPI0009905830|nr:MULTISPECIES: cyclic peptide export ABC transporter [unclassified Halomonas]AQU81381.1 peptide ABC transporter [Halomonas sp. 'Soap Lake \
MLPYLIRRTRGLMTAAAIASILSGLFSVLLIAQINTALNSDAASRANAAWTFAGIALALMACRMVSTALFERLGQRALAELRSFIAQCVAVTPFAQFERVGSARIQSALTEHSNNVAVLFVSLPVILTNTVIVVGCLGYLAVLSWQVFLFALGVIGLGAVGYHLVHLRAIHYLQSASSEQDRLFGHFRALTDGAKELRLHQRKSRVFMDQILGESVEGVRRLRTYGMSLFVISTSWGQFLMYAFIGLVLFVLVSDGPNQTQVMTGFALVFVFMVTPLEGLLINIPRINMARVAASRIDDITREMPQGQGPQEQRETPTLQRLELRGVTHQYYHEQSDDFFELGPINLSFTPGEVVFLVGGNGSGKTTLAKVVVGLYPPDGGEVLLNGERVEVDGWDAYRQLFSVVFSDFHLFERLLEAPRDDLDEEGNRLLAKLHLQHKVRVENGAFTTQALSQGQRKRLALVVAYLEDRPFLVFDEWAADQDPLFKEVFYTEVLPELKRMGKAVLVITHDDRYFHLADRLVRLESGKLLAPEQSAGAEMEVAPSVAT